MSCTCHYETGGEFDEQVWATCEECESILELVEPVVCHKCGCTESLVNLGDSEFYCNECLDHYATRYA